MTPVPPARRLLRAKDLIDARYREQLDVPALARAARLSTAHFSREFRPVFRRDAAPIPPDLPARAPRCAAPQHRPHGHGHLPHRRAAQHRVVHDERRPRVRHVAHRLPRELSASGHSRSDSDLCAPGLRAPAIQQFSRRLAKGAAGGLFFSTDDCEAAHEELKKRGVEFGQEPTKQPYGIDAGFRDPSGNQARMVQQR
ncbi:hypothetical protein BH18ACT12_BH18ACT12_05870 [soil metagenome]